MPPHVFMHFLEVMSRQGIHEIAKSTIFDRWHVFKVDHSRDKDLRERVENNLPLSFGHGTQGALCARRSVRGERELQHVLSSRDDRTGQYYETTIQLEEYTAH